MTENPVTTGVPTPSDLALADVAATTEQLTAEIRDAARRFRRAGAVVAVSGGIDSAVCVGLAARALGPRRVTALALPDQESSADSARLAAEVCDTFGVELTTRDITAPLEALGCYADRVAVVRKTVPDFDPERGDRFSVEFDPAMDSERLQSFALNVVRDGVATRHRLGGRDFLAIMAATNQKQRMRMLVTYRYADAENRIVVGTSNRLELDQGFFVKHGDGLGEVFPLAGLLKTQVYEVARYLGVPQSIVSRPPTTDTFSADQTQEAYFYGASVELGDRLWLGWHEGRTADEVAAATGLSASDVEKFFGLYTRRAAYAAYLKETL